MYTTGTLPDSQLEAMAAEEARRLYEVEFQGSSPHTRVIETDGVPVSQEEAFCRLVEDELALKGEKIHRNGIWFKICRYQVE